LSGVSYMVTPCRPGLYSDALSPPGGPAGTYLDMMRHNLATLTAALVPAPDEAPEHVADFTSANHSGAAVDVDRVEAS
jgi:hypothetical protein